MCSSSVGLYNVSSSVDQVPAGFGGLYTRKAVSFDWLLLLLGRCSWRLYGGSMEGSVGSTITCCASGTAGSPYSSFSSCLGVGCSQHHCSPSTSYLHFLLLGTLTCSCSLFLLLVFLEAPILELSILSW